MMLPPVLTEEELVQVTGYRRATEQLAELHARGFFRAYRNRLGRVTLERPHYDAVAAGQTALAGKPKAKVRLLRPAA